MKQARCGLHNSQSPVVIHLGCKELHVTYHRDQSFGVSALQITSSLCLSGSCGCRYPDRSVSTAQSDLLVDGVLIDALLSAE